MLNSHFTDQMEAVNLSIGSKDLRGLSTIQWRKLIKLAWIYYVEQKWWYTHPGNDPLLPYQLEWLPSSTRPIGMQFVEHPIIRL